MVRSGSDPEPASTTELAVIASDQRERGNLIVLLLRDCFDRYAPSQ